MGKIFCHDSKVTIQTQLMVLKTSLIFLKCSIHISYFFLLICSEVWLWDALDKFREIHPSVNFDTLSPGIIYTFKFLKVS